MHLSRNQVANLLSITEAHPIDGGKPIARVTSIVAQI